MTDAIDLKRIYASIFRTEMGAATREGTAIVDQIINPLVLVGTPFYEKVARIERQAAIPDNLLAPDLLELIGVRYFEPRIQGEKATGRVVIALTRPRQISIPRGTQFFTESRRGYIANRSYFFQADMLTQQSDGTYVTPDIEIVAFNEGSEYEMPARTIRETSIDATDIAYVTNLEPISGGQGIEEIGSYHERLQRAVSSRAMDTPRGLLFTISSAFGDRISRVTLLGAGDETLERDTQRIQFRTREVPIDLNATIRRQYDLNEYYQGNQVARIIGVDTEINADVISYPNSDMLIVAFDPELNRTTSSTTLDLGDPLLENKLRSAARYGQFMFIVMAERLVATLNLGFWRQLQDDFGVLAWRGLFGENVDSLPDTALPDLDANTGGVPPAGPQELPYPYSGDYWFLVRRGDFSFIPREGFLSEHAPERAPEITEQLVTVYTTLMQQLDEEGTLSPPISMAGKIRGRLSPRGHIALQRNVRLLEEPPGSSGEEEISQEAYNVISRPDLQGFVIETSDQLRDNLVRLDERVDEFGGRWHVGADGAAPDPDAETPGAILYRETLVFGPEIFEFSSIDSLFFDENGATPDDTGTPTDQSPVAQLPIVDPSGFAITTTVMTTSPSARMAVTAFRESEPTTMNWSDGFGLVMEAGGENPGDPVNVAIIDGDADTGVLAEVRYPILLGEKYHLRMVYNEPPENNPDDAITLQVWIWKDGERPDSQPTISTGAYVPTHRRTDTSYLASTDVGFGVDATGTATTDIGGEDILPYWIAGDLEITSIDATYAQLLLDLDVLGQRGILEFNLSAYGKGSDGSGSALHGHRVLAWDTTTEQWILIQDVTYDEGRIYNHVFEMELKPEYVESGRMKLLVTSPYPHRWTTEDVVPSELHVNYIYGRSITSERRTYGKTDYYYVARPDETWRPSREQTLTLTSPGIQNEIKAEDLGGPIEEITAIEITGGAQGATPSLIPGSEYRYFFNNRSHRGSMRETVTIILDPTYTAYELLVRARVYDAVHEIDAFTRESDRQKRGWDLLVRHKQSVFVDLRIRHEGRAPEALREGLREFLFNFTGNELDASDIVQFMGTYSVGGVELYDGTNDDKALRLIARRIDDNGNVVRTESYQQLKKTITESFVPGNLSMVSTTPPVLL